MVSLVSDMLSVVSGHFFGFKCMLSNWRTYDMVVNSNSVEHFSFKVMQSPNFSKRQHWL